MNTPPPTTSDHAVIEAAAKQIAAKLTDWHEESSIEDITAHLCKALRTHRDGYHIARYMDDVCDYEVTANKVEILDRASSLISSEHKKAMKAWVIQTGASGPPIGSIVTHPLYKGPGEVTRNTEEGTSHVFFPQEGHVRQGTGTLAAIIPWHTLTIPTTPEPQES